MDKIYLLIRNCDNGESYEDNVQWQEYVAASDDKAKLKGLVRGAKWFHFDEPGYFDVTEDVIMTESEKEMRKGYIFNSNKKAAYYYAIEEVNFIN